MPSALRREVNRPERTSSPAQISEVVKRRESFLDSLDIQDVFEVQMDAARTGVAAGNYIDKVRPSVSSALDTKVARVSGKVLKAVAAPAEIALMLNDARRLAVNSERREGVFDRTQQMEHDPVAARLAKGYLDPVDILYGTGRAIVETRESRINVLEAAEELTRYKAIDQRIAKLTERGEAGDPTALRRALAKGVQRQKVWGWGRPTGKPGRGEMSFRFPDGTYEVVKAEQ